MKLTPTKEQENIINTALSGDNMVVDARAGAAKGVTLDTLIPTPDRGLVPARDLKVGDQVFSADGTATTIELVSGINTRPTYEVTFSDDVSVVVDDEHRWLVRRADYRGRWGEPEVITTEEMHTQGITVSRPNGSNSRRSFSIPMTEPVQYPHADLPIDPWLLGAWLGDGSSRVGIITNGESDLQQKLVTKHGARVRKNHNRADSVIIPGLTSLLSSVGVKNNKEIPDVYFNASVEQRMELIRGLMDTDGTVNDRNGGYVFCTTKLVLAQGFRRLVHSLGVKATVSESSAKLNGRDYGLAYKVSFSTAKFLPVTSEKHLSKVKAAGRLDDKRYIVDIQPKGVDNTVCFKVSHPSELFLVTPAFIVTHNTSTLQLVANEVLKPTLYLAYNRAMADEAQGRFPSHVDVMTTHSLAYRNVGNKYRSKLSRPKGPWRNMLGTGKEVAMHFKIGTYEVGNKLINGSTVGYAVVNTVNRYEHSAEVDMGEKHVSLTELWRKGVDLNKDAGVQYYVKDVLKYAKQLWDMRRDLKSQALATHDTYLKLYQLSKPDLSHYDVILLDEGQDTNATTLDIFKRQDKGSQLIIVGDNLQQIYGWRGAVNALAQLPWENLQLTKSFRFGPRIAELARNIILDEDWMPYITLEGFEKLDTEVFDTEHDLVGPTTYVYRTNGALLLAALKHIEAGKQVNMVVETAGFKRKLFSAMALRKDDRKGIKHPDIQMFDTWDEFVEDGEMRDPEHRHIYNIITQGHFHRVVTLLEDYYPSTNPESTFITAHKSKGLEWDNVVLGDDFKTVKQNDDGEYHYTDEGERNLLYVAATRAKKALVTNSDVRILTELSKNSQAVTKEAF